MNGIDPRSMLRRSSNGEPQIVVQSTVLSVITMIKSKNDLICRFQDRLAGLEPSTSSSRAIAFGPLFNLKLLHDLMEAESDDGRTVRLANDDVFKDLENEGWTDVDVRQIIASLVSKDYKKSEWARIHRGRRWVACDVYVTPYDSLRRRRHVRGVQVYLKFSVDTLGRVTILVASCHCSS